MNNLVLTLLPEEAEIVNVSCQRPGLSSALIWSMIRFDPDHIRVSAPYKDTKLYHDNGNNA